MSSNIPHVRIRYGWLLAEITSGPLHAARSNGDPLGTPREFTVIAETYESWWRPYNDKVLRGICEITKLEFTQNTIDVYVAPWFTPISDPMVLGPAFGTQDALVVALSHELIHRLLSDNTKVPYDHKSITDWERLFSGYDTKTTVHIPVHAVLKALYLDLLQRPDLLAYDIEKTKAKKAYADAWRYVERNDYKAIIQAIGK